MYAIDIIWIWFMLGYNMIIYLAAAQEVSTELLEAPQSTGPAPGKRFAASCGRSSARPSSCLLPDSL